MPGTVKQVKRSRVDRLILLFAISLLIFNFNTNAADNELFSQIIETDLDQDGIAERIEVDSRREMTLRISHGDTFLWEGVPARWKPWKVEIADVDGDGKREIAVGVFKSTKFFPKPHNCLFIYGFSDDKGFPKWLGSSLSRPFTDFVFADLDRKDGDDLIAIETGLDGRQSVAGYFWDSFGFTRKWQRGDWDSLEFVKSEDGDIAVDGDGERFILKDFENRGKP